MKVNFWLQQTQIDETDHILLDLANILFQKQKLWKAVWKQKTNKSLSFFKLRVVMNHIVIFIHQSKAFFV